MFASVICRRETALLACCALGLLFVSGCGLKRVPASGSIEVDGKPLEGGIIYFNPNTAKGNNTPVSCSSPIQNGHFQVRTTAMERSDTGPGIPLGWYKISLRVNMPGEKPMFAGPVVEIDRKYLSPEETTLEVEVVENPEPGRYDFKINSR
jgi:hypothetical protein